MILPYAEAWESGNSHRALTGRRSLVTCLLASVSSGFLELALSSLCSYPCPSPSLSLYRQDSLTRVFSPCPVLCNREDFDSLKPCILPKPPRLPAASWLLSSFNSWGLVCSNHIPAFCLQRVCKCLHVEAQRMLLSCGFLGNSPIASTGQ